MGFLYDMSLAGLIGLTVVAQVAAIPLFVKVVRQTGTARGE
jgi:hypothetical protein